MDELKFIATKDSCPDLDAAILRFNKQLSAIKKSHTTKINNNISAEAVANFRGNLEVELLSPCSLKTVPQFGAAENYEIYINARNYRNRAVLKSNSLWGIYYAMETCTQLIYYSSDDGKFKLRQGVIKDFPRFRHRGLLLDTSRHYISKDIIKMHLDLMAQNKMNVFHWHIVDDPSFPFVSQKYPNLSKLGAYTPEMVYTEKDVSELIEYARLRGIRVIPEFDTPGHMRSWGVSQPDLLTPCYDPDGQPNGQYGSIDPTRQANFAFVENFLGEVADRFPDRFLHLGGDEVSFGFDCWRSNPNIQRWMRDNNITSNEELERFYIAKLDQLEKKKTHIYWQEVFDNRAGYTINNNSVVHVWKGNWQRTVNFVTRKGFHVILSSCWYLNYISYGIDWYKYYRCDPDDFFGDSWQKQLVLGGEACMWSEYADNYNIVPRTWPRASAVAERLWSSRDVRSIEPAQKRLEEHRCRLSRRGYPVQSINGPGYC